MVTSPAERAADSFAAELTRWRVERGLSKKQLAGRMGFDPSYVSHVEGRRHRPTEDFARRAEAVLQAGGAIWRSFQRYDEVRHARAEAGVANRDPPVPEQWLPPGTGLVVDHEVASLSYQDGAYLYDIRRSLYNAGTEPVTRYLVRLVVDRFPNEPERSNRHHHEHPLTWGELNVQAFCGDPPGRERMEWRPKRDRDTDKEVWLMFENEHGRFPLYPGERTTIEYTFTIGEEKFGQWFQRAIRLPTRRLSIQVDLPAALEPQVWGVETSLSAEEVPLRTPIVRADQDGRARFEWTTDAPLLNARYRLEWRFRSQGTDPTESPAGPSLPVPDRLHALGILRRGNDLLRQPARPLDLPRDEATAREVVGRLLATLRRVEELHLFSKGAGLAAPQLGLPWAAAVVRPPDPAAAPLTLLNPRVVDASSEQDQQYEGCLSFFDVRGQVRRPLVLDVEHDRWDGTRVITTFENAMARLVAHEIDHLEGRLYTDLMAPGAVLVPVEEYRESGRPWAYPARS
jgi:peptide deformylase